MKCAFVWVAVLALVVPCAQGSFSYGTDVNGQTVTYTTIDACSNIWGNMQVNGDALMFFPTNFSVQADGSPSTEMQIGTLQFTIQSKPGEQGQGSDRFIKSVEFYEYGRYTLTDDLGTGSVSTLAEVTCGIHVQIMEINRQPVNGSQYNISTNLTFAPSGGNYNLVDDGPGSLMPWTGQLNLDLEAYYSQITKISVSINNQLKATNEDGTIAFIDKKGFGENPATYVDVIIPEPATIAMLGLGAVALIRKRT